MGPRLAEDAAFIWDSRPATPRPPSPGAGTPEPAVKWVTLREAADDTGVALSTIRNWARKGRVPTRLEDRPEGTRRMVGLVEVRERAARRAAGDGARRAEEAPAAPETQPAPEYVDPAGGAPPVPDGHLLVPLDAWEKMLVQLGNLHEAGQQLAAARERAAKAETEAAFLRERLAELRRAPATGGGEEAPPSAPADDTASAALRARVAAWYRRLARRSS